MSDMNKLAGGLFGCGCLLMLVGFVVAGAGLLVLVVLGLGAV